MGRAQVIRQGIDVEILHLRQALMHQPAQPVLTDPGGQSVDGHHPARVQTRARLVVLAAGFENLEIRMRHLGPAPVHLDDAADHHLPAGLELLQQELLVEPDTEQDSGIIAHRHGEHTAAAAGPPLAGGQDLPLDRRILTRLEAPDGHRTAAIEIAPGIVAQKVADGFYPQAG